MLLDEVYVVLLALGVSILIWLVVGKTWLRWKNAFHNGRYSYVDITFILLYFVEQLLLAYFIYAKFNAQIISGIFSIIVITTASLQNKSWESRTRKIGETAIDQGEIIKSQALKMNNLISENEKLRIDLEETREFAEDTYKELEKYKGKLKKN